MATPQHGGWLVLNVTDNGCGMTDEFLQQSGNEQRAEARPGPQPPTG